MRTALVFLICMLCLAADASAQRQGHDRGPGARGEALDTHLCGDDDALCVAAALIHYIGETAANRVRYGILIAHMYDECSRFDDAKCAAKFIGRAYDQAQTARELETERFHVRADQCKGGQCNLGQQTADHLCQGFGYDYAVAADPYGRRRNIRECGWGSDGWDCDNRCRSCGNGIEWVTCGR